MVNAVVTGVARGKQFKISPHTNGHDKLHARVVHALLHVRDVHAMLHAGDAHAMLNLRATLTESMYG